MMGFLMTCQNSNGKRGIPTEFGLNTNTEVTGTSYAGDTSVTKLFGR